MSWWNPMSWGREPSAALDVGPGGVPDLSEFERASWGAAVLGAQELVTLGTYGVGCRPDTPPNQVPVDVIDAMGYHPVISLYESVVTAPATDPELYYLDGPADLVAETEAWLRPLLHLQLFPVLQQIARAFGFGAIPIVLDWVVADLQIPAAAEGGPVRVLSAHAHYVRAHEVWPGDAELRVQNDLLLGVRHGGYGGHGGRDYGGEGLADPGLRRGYLALWDPKPGREQAELWRGQGARRRAYRDWFEEGMARLWQIRYLERSVDIPRVGFGPEGNLRSSGRAPQRATNILRDQLMALRNGSAIVLPSTQDANGNKAWDVKVLEVPDRHQVFGHAIDSRGGRMAMACLVPQGTGKEVEEQTMDSVQRVCDFVAGVLTRIVNAPLQLRGERRVVRVLANTVPKRKQRILAEVFKATAAAQQHLADGKVYTLGELVHPEILDALGVKRRTVEEAKHAPAPAAPGRPGRPIDVAGAREERRDVADTIEGEEDVGKERDQLDARSRSDALGLVATTTAKAFEGQVRANVRLAELLQAPVPPTPIVNVTVPSAPPTPVEITVPSAPPTPVVVNVSPTPIVIEAPAPIVVPAPVVHVAVPSFLKTVDIKIHRGRDDRITGATADEGRRE